MAAGRPDADAASDSESVNALLRPSDGFFSQAEVPNEVLVPDPRQRNTQAEKEREARMEQADLASSSRRGHAAQAPSHLIAHRPISASSWRSSIINTEADERDPLMPAAPPAYSDIAQDTNTSHRLPLGYSTMDQVSPFFPNPSPQDLGGAEQQPLLGQDARPPCKSWRDVLRNASRWTKLIALVCTVLFGLALVVTVIFHNRESKDMDRSLRGPAAGARPVPANCRHATFKARDSVTIKDASSFMFEEKHQIHRGHRHKLVDISGEVRLQSTASQEHAIKLDVEYRTNQESLLDAVRLKPSPDTLVHEDTLHLWLPRYSDGSDSPDDRNCLDVDITISVAPGTHFEHLTLSLLQISIGITNVDYTAKSTRLRCATGSIRASDCHYMNSREIRLHSGVGPISGTYPLYDLLSIDTSVGPVEVRVDPKAADKHNLPAKFQVQSSTGTVSATASIREVPPRDYQTSIVTGPGKISIGDFMHGSTTELHSGVASVKAVALHPVGDLDKNSTIDVSTITGSIDMGIRPHMWSPDKRMNHLSGRYSSSTGAVRITHPLQWEGTVRAHTGIGSLNIEWPGLKQTEKDEDRPPPWLAFPSSDFEGVKGEGDAVIEAKSGTGSVYLFGRDPK